jgi:biopolymer transport protein ExbB
MNTKGQTFKEVFQSIFASSVILICLAVAIFIYSKILGDPSHFVGGNHKGHPIEGDYLGIAYKGGPVVPVLITLILVMLVFSVERFITLARAKGRGRISSFVRNIQSLLNDNKVEEAISACDKQKGSIANVVRSGLHRFRVLQSDKSLGNDQKVLALQKDLEEATALELPMMSKNLVILSTIASIAVLTGLIGTVLGMIRAFAALAQSGAPDALALSTGISEALVNTALGITGSALAIVFYNLFSTKIDQLTYKIDEVNFSVTQTFAESLGTTK